MVCNHTRFWREHCTGEQATQHPPRPYNGQLSLFELADYLPTSGSEKFAAELIGLGAGGQRVAVDLRGAVVVHEAEVGGESFDLLVHGWMHGLNRKRLDA